jgi:predicted NBD/HSP70 family sugar kinase
VNDETRRGSTAWWIAREWTNAYRASVLKHKGGPSLHTWDDLMPDNQAAAVDAAQALIDSGVVLLGGPPWHYRRAWLRRLRFRLRHSQVARILRGHAVIVPSPSAASTKESPSD